jgi:hypothetical protein
MLQTYIKKGEIVMVVKEKELAVGKKLKDAIKVGDYIGITTEDGYSVGVVSKVREKTFDVHGFLLSGTYDAHTTLNPRLHDMPFYFEEVLEYDVPLHPLHSYIAEDFKHIQWKAVQENESREKGFTEDQLIEVLEGENYRFFDLGFFDKDLFLTVASDFYEYSTDTDLWYGREDNEFVYLCNACDEMYEDELDRCERNNCTGSIRKVSKDDMGM